MAEPTATTVDTVLVTARGPKTLHLPGGDGPRCGTPGRFVEKPLTVFPPGHRDWCSYCHRLREGVGATPVSQP